MKVLPVAPLMADPNKGLKSKSADDRLLTAALLLAKYRPYAMASQKTEAIDETQSKLILEALASADWKKTDNLMRFNGQALFYRLGVTAQDGWKQPGDFQQFETAAKEWLKSNAGTFRIKRFVLAEK